MHHSDLPTAYERRLSACNDNDEVVNVGTFARPAAHTAVDKIEAYLMLLITIRCNQVPPTLPRNLLQLFVSTIGTSHALRT